jgi:poly-gamma-glutamate synthesis protein (capsule biosynthesis protein)
LLRLQDYSQRLQEARTSRRMLLRAGAESAAVALAGSPLAAGASVEPAAPLSNLVLAQGLAAGTALVTSLRLPLPGIGSGQVAPLLQGDYTHWHQVGVPTPLPVTLIAIDGLVPEGTSPAEMVADYNELAERLDEIPGGFARLPIEMIDPRVNIPDIDGVNPLLALATESEPVIKVGVAGDIIFGRKGGNRQRDFGDYTMPMWQVKEFLSTFDVTVANFECFVSETLEFPELTDPRTFDFVTRPDSLHGMVMAGIDAVTMANNHAVFSYGGYGLPGMQDTIRHLNDAGIVPWGVGMDLDEARAPWVKEVGGMSIAFYGIDGVTANLEFPNGFGVQSDNEKLATRIPVDARADRGGTNPLKLDQNLADIERLAGEHDIVLPYIHMGDQYRWTPRPWVVETCHKLVDAGAAAVLTAHPHACQGMEIYKGKPIFYSIGNFVYDQMFSVETRQGYFLDLTFRGKDLVGFRIHPVEIMDFVQPRFMSPGERVCFNDRFWRSIDLTRKEYGYDSAMMRPE